MRAIWGIALALAGIFGTMSLASADNSIPVIQDTRGEQFTGFANVNPVYEIVLVPHPCDPDSNLLFAPDDPIVRCAEEEELDDYISDVAERAIGISFSIDDLFIPEVTNLNDLGKQIRQLDTISNSIFEHETKDLTETILDEQVIEQYQTIKDTWEKEMIELEENADALFEENPGIESQILEQEIEKLKIKFDLKEEKIKNLAKVEKKIKTAIELNSLKEKLQDSINEYGVAEKFMKYGDEKDKKLEQLFKENKKLMKKMLIVEAKHHDKKLEFDDFKKIDEKIVERIENSVSYVSYSSGQTDSDVFSGSGDTNNGNDSEGTNDSQQGNSGGGSQSGNSGKGSDNGNSGKGSDNKGKGSDKSNGSDNKGKGNNSSKGKGNSKK